MDCLTRVQLPAKQLEYFLFPATERYLQGWDGWSVKLTTYLHLVQRLRVYGALHLVLSCGYVLAQKPVEINRNHK